MFLKELTKDRLITITYYQNGSLQTCKGRVCNLDLHQQTLFLKDEQQKVFFIRLADIKEIH
ncbi:YolD-like family protein [Ectobacillus panaciterrae]|uniref:YolD-like family protein n=1 Tax=Ectobacillus panaciterrae TaxID=363872 RepID=UPI00042361C6|nr:YolD-like family protein [Ectobacillus panaciterrae]